jgi:hypothetical protein
MIGALMLAATLAAATPCEGLKSLSGPDMTITAAEIVAAGPYTAGRGQPPVALPAHCRIAGVLAPTP